MREKILNYLSANEDEVYEYTIYTLCGVALGLTLSIIIALLLT